MINSVIRLLWVLGEEIESFYFAYSILEGEKNTKTCEFNRRRRVLHSACQVLREMAKETGAK